MPALRQEWRLQVPPFGVEAVRLIFYNDMIRRMIMLVFYDENRPPRVCDITSCSFGELLVAVAVWEVNIFWRDSRNCARRALPSACIGRLAAHA